jgi:hypothetical protein
MKAARMIVTGGLVLTLGAFGLTLARAAENANNNPNSTNYSENSGANDSQNSAANNRGSNAPTAAVPENENQSTEANQNPVNPQYENENTAPFHPSNHIQGQQQQGNENSARLSQEQSHIGHMIYRLDRELSDAETYEAAGREDWSNNDIAGAQRNFRTAEHILRMATGGGNFGPAYFGQNPHQQEMVAEQALNQAKKAGANVTDARAYLDQGKQALKQGHDAEASRDFRAAELALGIPVEVGYAEVWETEVPVQSQNRGTAENQQGEPQAENGQMTMTQPNNNQGQTNGMGQNGNLGDAQSFLRAGEQALANGDQAQAQRDFRAADRAMSMNESGHSNSH